MNDPVFTPAPSPNLKYTVDEFGVQYDDSYYEDRYLSNSDLITLIEEEIRLSREANMPPKHMAILNNLLKLAKESKNQRSIFKPFF